MNLWTALIILNVSSSPVTVDTGHKNEPMSVDVIPGDPSNKDPVFHMEMKQPQWTKIDRMTGVEADVYVNVPSSTSLSFPTERMCESAVAKLIKAGGIQSVTCVQTGE